MGQKGEREREVKIRNQTKWSKFKERRGPVVDGYIAAIKKLRRAQEMVRNLGVYIMFKRVAELVEKEAARRRHVRHGKFMSVVLANKWKVKTKKMGGSL